MHFRNSFSNYLLLFFLTVFFSVIIAACGKAQKIDVEKKIPESEFPPAAVQWLKKEYSNQIKIRYFIEIEADVINYEAKFCFEKEKYSIVFLKDGELCEIEKEIEYSILPASTQKNIELQLNADFKKWKIARLQERTLPPSPILTYELLAKGKGESGVIIYNYYFSKNGEVLKKSKIVLPSKIINQY